MSITELNERFGKPNEALQEDVSGELQSIMRLHSLSEQELFFKWEAYSIKMGAENTTMDYKTVRDFKKDLQDALDREFRGKSQHTSASKRAVVNNTRSANTGDVYDVLDGMVGGTPSGARSAVKRRNNFETPASKQSKAGFKSSPSEQKAQSADTTFTSFADRPNAGQVIETLNIHITAPAASSGRPSEARVKLKANTELAKFNYKTMAMKLSEASEILDDRIDEFAALIQEHHGFPDAAFGNPAAQSSSEIIAVGRIASDVEGRVNAASLTLETSRRMGAGLRVPLRVENQAFDFFPGKIVALRGVNPSGEVFIVSEIVPMPLLPLPASTPEELDVHNAKLNGSSEDGTAGPLNVMICSGPYTPDTDLSFSALHEALNTASLNATDVLVLNGPFLDLDHPLIASGDFTLPDDYPVSPDRATLIDAFRAFISAPLTDLANRCPTITIILVPSTRDAVAKHVSYPQDRFARRELGLPKQATCVTNPITLSINEIVVGISSLDVLVEMQRQSVSQQGQQNQKTSADNDVLARLSRNVVEQRHFFPVYPPLSAEQLPKPAQLGAKNGDVNRDSDDRLATPACIDLPYLKLGEWIGVRPDLLITPSALTPFAKVVESVVVVNPGSLSKRRGPGTFVRMTVLPRQVRDAEREQKAVGHELYDRARVDVVRI